MLILPHQGFMQQQGGLPQYSIDFESGSSQRLDISAANFGSYDHAKFAIFLQYKQESAGSFRTLFSQNAIAGGNHNFTVYFQSNNKLVFRTFSAATTTDGLLVTSGTFTDTASWHRLLVHFDVANGTSGDRMRIWHDGVEITAFDTDTAPSSNIYSNANDFHVGGDAYAGLFDGLIYQCAFFSGYLPADAELYDSGTIDIGGVTGLHSYLNCQGGDVTHDGKLAAAWTNVNTAVASATVPA